MEIIKENKKEIKKIIAALSKGAVLVLPTDTVYGLVCDASNENALNKIFSIKKRPKSKPLLIFINDIANAKKIAKINKIQEKEIATKWPGKTTFILETKKDLSILVQKNNTIGLRIPKYNFLNFILKEFKKPLAQTSANISNKPATTKIKNVLVQLKNNKIKPDIIVDAGNLPKSDPSTIINITEEKIKIIRK